MVAVARTECQAIGDPTRRTWAKLFLLAHMGMDRITGIEHLVVGKVSTDPEVPRMQRVRLELLYDESTR